MIPMYDYKVETVVGTIFRVETNDPDPKFKTGSKLSLEGNILGSVRDIKLFQDDKLVPAVRKLGITVDVTDEDFRTFDISVIALQPSIPGSSKNIATGRLDASTSNVTYVIIDSNTKSILDKEGTTWGSPRFFTRKSSASNSLNKRKWENAEVVAYQVSPYAHKD